VLELSYLKGQPWKHSLVLAGLEREMREFRSSLTPDMVTAGVKDRAIALSFNANVRHLSSFELLRSPAVGCLQLLLQGIIVLQAISQDHALKNF
jgi:hypothetical protein